MRIVVHGTGAIGMRHLRLFATLPDVQVTAVPVRQERILELEGEGLRTARTLEQAIARGADGVVIATDTGRHAADALIALSAGCHVLIEKPLAPSRSEAQPVVEMAEARGLTAHVACVLRHDAGLRWARDRVPAIGGLRLGDVECVSWLPSWRAGRDPRTGYAARPGEGGVLLDLIHEIDYTAWMLGPQMRVVAYFENKNVLGLSSEVEETALLILLHGSTLPITMRLSYVVRPARRGFRLWGDAGMLEWDQVRRHARLFDTRGAEVEVFDGPAPDAMYEVQAQAWLAVLRGGTAPEGMLTAREALSSLAVCDAARRSARAGSWAEVS